MYNIAEHDRKQEREGDDNPGNYRNQRSKIRKICKILKLRAPTRIQLLVVRDAIGTNNTL